MSEIGLTILRLALGAVFVAHGAPRLLPLWESTPAPALFDTLGFSYGLTFTLAVAALECVGGLALLAGVFTHWASLVLAIEIAAAAWTIHLPRGFFLNWTLQADTGHGVEFHLVLLAALVCLVLGGAGALSVDRRRARSAEALAMGRARLRSRKV